jgi:predicted phosphodiesterase
MKIIKRLGAIGDIHAEDRLLLKAIEFLKTQNVDGIVSVGDIADGIGCINTCCDLLQAEKVITVAGNHASLAETVSFLGKTRNHLICYLCF